MKRSIPFTLILFFAVLGGSVSAIAQSLALAPGEVRQKFKPGVPFELELATSNQSATAAELSVQITDLWYDEKTNEKLFSDPGTSPRSAANWIQFVPDHFEIGSHGTQKLRAIITPPADAKGGYYATLFVKSTPQLAFDHTKDGKQVYTAMRLGCLVMLSAENTEEFKVEISNVKVTPPSANGGLDLSFDLLNGSNTHIFPVARVAVLDGNRKMVAKAESKEKRYLPGQKNSMNVSWAGSLPAGNYTAVLTVTYGEDHIETQAVPFTVAAQ